VRVGLTLVVALLTFSASGLSALVVSEPCAGYEQSSQDESACPPTCVTCGCCAQAVEPVALAVSGTPDAPTADILDRPAGAPRTTSRDILHVPKSRRA